MHKSKTKPLQNIWQNQVHLCSQWSTSAQKASKKQTCSQRNPLGLLIDTDFSNSFKWLLLSDEGGFISLFLSFFWEICVSAVRQEDWHHSNVCALNTVRASSHCSICTKKKSVKSNQMFFCFTVSYMQFLVWVWLPGV